MADMVREDESQPLVEPASTGQDVQSQQGDQSQPPQQVSRLRIIAVSADEGFRNRFQVMLDSKQCVFAKDVGESDIRDLAKEVCIALNHFDSLGPAIEPFQEAAVNICRHIEGRQSQFLVKDDDELIKFCGPFYSECRKQDRKARDDAYKEYT